MRMRFAMRSPLFTLLNSLRNRAYVTRNSAFSGCFEPHGETHTPIDSSEICLNVLRYELYHLSPTFSESRMKVWIGFFITIPRGRIRLSHGQPPSPSPFLTPAASPSPKTQERSSCEFHFMLFPFCIFSHVSHGFLSICLIWPFLDLVPALLCGFFSIHHYCFNFKEFIARILNKFIPSIFNKLLWPFSASRMSPDVPVFITIAAFLGYIQGKLVICDILNT